MLSWHFFAVALVPGLGLFALRPSAALLGAVTFNFLGLVTLIFAAGWPYALGLWAVGHLTAWLCTPRHVQ